MRYKKIVLLLIGVWLFYGSNAQIFPVQATTQLVPPYSVYLPDYATGINNQLRVLLLNKDINQPGYKVKLKMTIELNGSIIMRTSDYFNPAAITLEPNQPYSVEGNELAAYLNGNNIDFIGYSKQDYEQKKGLPEGAYKICFTAYDYFRPDLVKVSNEACSYYYLTKNDPPFLSMPACGIFIAPIANVQENLVEKAGRWLSYTLDIPWTDGEKEIWYNYAVVPLTQQFDGSFNNEQAKSMLISLGQQYATEKGKEWVNTYGIAWADLVFNEFTLDKLEYWNKNLIKYSSSSDLDLNANATAEIQTEIDMVAYMTTNAGNNANINFSWTPRHTNSPNSTLSTLYRLELFEINPLAPNAQLAAMANNTVQTMQPIFVDDISTTSYQYGPDKPALTDGKQYAWRVKAYDAGGRDWFKNNGYSEVCYFTFGGVPENEQLPQMEQVQVFAADGEGERRGKMYWSQTGAYTQYKVRYRKQGGTGNWFEVETDSLLAKVYDLEPNTIYQAQVQGKAGQFYGPFSAIDTFKTFAIAPPPGCGLPINAAAGLSTMPLPNAEATPNIFIKVGKFELQVDSIGNTGGPGYFTGKGRINSIPFLAIVQTLATAMGGNTQSNGGLQVQFNNVFINQNREVTQGDVYAVSRSLEEWADGWDTYYEERRREQQQRRNRDLFSNLDSNAVFLPQFNFTISGVVFDSVSNTINIINQNGDTVRVVLNANQIGHDIVIQGQGNDQWVVRPDGTVSLVSGGGLYPGMNRNITELEIDFLKRAISRLKNSYDSIYVVDKNMFDQKKVARDQLTNAFYSNDNNITNNGTTVISEGYLGSALINSTSVTPFTIADKNYKLAEHQMNKHELIKTLANSLNHNSSLEIIAKILIVQGKNGNQFINDSKSAGKTDAYIEIEIKKELDIFIEGILKSNEL